MTVMALEAKKCHFFFKYLHLFTFFSPLLTSENDRSTDVSQCERLLLFCFLSTVIIKDALHFEVKAHLSLHKSLFSSALCQDRKANDCIFLLLPALGMSLTKWNFTNNLTDRNFVGGWVGGWGSATVGE
jgi:hypothetical protein